MDDDDYGGADAVELPDDHFSSPGSTYSVGGGRYTSADAVYGAGALGPRDDYDIHLTEMRALQTAMAAPSPAPASAGIASSGAVRRSSALSPTMHTGTPVSSARAVGQSSTTATTTAGSNRAATPSIAPAANRQGGVDLLQALANKPYLYTPGSEAGGSPYSANVNLYSSSLTAPTSTNVVQQHRDNSGSSAQSAPSMSAPPPPRSAASQQIYSSAAWPSSASAMSAPAPTSIHTTNTQQYAADSRRASTAAPTAQVTGPGLAASQLGSGTVITPSGVVVAGGQTDSGKLAAKVHAQALELADLTLKLQKSDAYAHLVERRLLEIAPSHQLPVNEALMGTHVDALSKLALSAAQSLTGVVTPGKISGVASHMIAVTAAQRKETMDQVKEIRELKRVMERDRKKLDDAVKRIKDLKAALDNSGKDRANALRRAEGLQQKVISLEAEMRLAGLVPASVTAGPGIEIMPTSHHPNAAASAAGGSGYPSAQQSGGGDGASAATGARRASIGGSPGVSHQELIAKIAILEGELSSARAARDAAQDKLSHESRAGEQQRAYITVLERQLSASSSGGDGGAAGKASDTAHLLTQIARLQGELEARQRDSNSRDSQVRDVQSQLREAQATIASLQQQLTDAHGRAAAAHAANVNASRGNPNGNGGGGLSTPARGSTANGTGVVVRSPALGEITSNSHVYTSNNSMNITSPGMHQQQYGRGHGGYGLPVTTSSASSGLASHTPGGTAVLVPGLLPGQQLPQPVIDVMSRLEAEKGALLDYISETRDAFTGMAAQVKALEGHKESLEQQLSRYKSEADAQSKAATAAENEANRLSRELLDTQTRLASADSKVAQLANQYADASRNLADGSAEVHELRLIQDELLTTIREHAKAADSAKSEAESCKSKHLEAERRLKFVEDTLEQCEAERDAAEQRVRELRAQLESTQERVNGLSHQLDTIHADHSRVLGEKSACEARISTLERRIESSEASKSAAEAASKESEVKAGSLTVELQTLSRISKTVEDAEAAVARFLKAHAGEDMHPSGGRHNRDHSDDIYAGTGDENAVSASGYQHFDHDGGRFDDADDAAGDGGGHASAMRSPGKVPGQHHRGTSSTSASSPAAPSQQQHSGGARGGKDDDSPAFKQVQHAASAGSKAVARAESALRWATDASINSAVPQVATAARQLSGWLRIAGIALCDVARRMGQELEDRRLQRRMLYDEIHGLRDQLKDTQDTLVRERARGNEAESRANGLQRQVDTDLARLSSRLTDVTGDRDDLRATVERLSHSLGEAQNEVSKLSASNATLDSQLKQATTAYESIRKHAEQISHEKAAAETERDSLIDQLSTVQQHLDEARSHSSVLNLEKKALADRINALESQLRESHSEVRSCAEKLSAAQRDAQAAVARAEHAASALGHESEAHAHLQQQYAAVKSNLQETEMVAQQQNVIIEKLLNDLQALGVEKDRFQQTMASLSVELEGAKAALEGGNTEIADRIDVFVSDLRRLGIDVSGVNTGISSGYGISGSAGASTSAAAAHFRNLAHSAANVSNAAFGRGGAGGGSSSTSLATHPLSSPTASSSSGGHDQQQQQSASAYSQVHGLISRQRQLNSALLSAGAAAANRVNQLMSEVSSVKGELQALKPRVDAVNDVVHSAQEKQRLLSAAEQRVAFLESELASAASQLTTSQAERNNLREKLQDCNVELEQSRTRVAMLISDTEGYRESERRAQAALMEAHSQIQALQQDIDNMRKDADGLVAQRARAEASTQREVNRINELAADLATLNAQKARAEQALSRANEQLSQLRSEVIELRSNGNALQQRIAELQGLCSQREAEVQAHKAQLHQLAGLQVELESKVAQDIGTLTSDTAAALSVKQQYQEQLAVKFAECEALRAELNAVRASSSSAADYQGAGSGYDSARAGSGSSRAPSPLPTRGRSSSSAVMTPGRYSISALPQPPVPSAVGAGSSGMAYDTHSGYHQSGAGGGSGGGQHDRVYWDGKLYTTAQLAGSTAAAAASNIYSSIGSLSHTSTPTRAYQLAGTSGGAAGASRSSSVLPPSVAYAASGAAPAPSGALDRPPLFPSASSATRSSSVLPSATAAASSRGSQPYNPQQQEQQGDDGGAASGAAVGGGVNGMGGYQPQYSRDAYGAGSDQTDQLAISSGTGSASSSASASNAANNTARAGVGSSGSAARGPASPGASSSAVLDGLKQRLKDSRERLDNLQGGGSGGGGSGASGRR